MGGGAHDFVVEQASQPPYALGKEGRELAVACSACLRSHLAQLGSFRIESKPERTVRPGSDAVWSRSLVGECIFFDHSTSFGAIHSAPPRRTRGLRPWRWRRVGLLVRPSRYDQFGRPNNGFMR